MEDVQLQVGVKVFLKNNEGKYLLLKRSSKYGDLKGIWDIVGGRINPGTPLEDNLRREVKEETGLEFTGEAKLIYSQDILKFPGKHVVRLSYTGNVSGEPVIDSESDAFKWMSLQEMQNEQDLDPFVREILNKGLVS